jgi:ubiquinone/menaquinone biosynthesis C-methylase UbiE
VTVLVLDGSLLPAVLAQAGDEDVIVVDMSAARLEEFERAAADPRAFYLIGEPAVLPLPDASIDAAVGEGVRAELRRVYRTVGVPDSE